MRIERVVLLVVLAAAAAVPVGCVRAPVEDVPSSDPGALLDLERVRIPNELPDPETDPWPLSIGAVWRFRDATADHRPTYHPGEGGTVEVVATVASAQGEELYVVRSSYSDGVEEVAYLHRESSRLLIHGSHTDRSVVIADPPGTRLWTPFSAGLSWVEEAGSWTRSWEVLYQESLIFHGGSYPGAWKLELRDASTGDTELRWFAEGVGPVKVSRQSLTFELVERNLDSGRNAHVIGVENHGEDVVLREGDLLIVLLPAYAGTQYDWHNAADVDPEVLLPVDPGTFYADLAPADPVSGSYVASWQAVAPTPIDRPAAVEWVYLGPGKDEPRYRLSAWVTVTR